MHILHINFLPIFTIHYIARPFNVNIKQINQFLLLKLPERKVHLIFSCENQATNNPHCGWGLKIEFIDNKNKNNKGNFFSEMVN